VRDPRFFNRGPAPELFGIVLSSLRAAALPWAAGRYPAHANELRVFASLASGITITYSGEAATSAAATIAYDDSAVAPIAADAVAAAFRAYAAAAYAGETEVDLVNSGLSGAQLA
jgi:hypothetical protein